MIKMGGSIPQALLLLLLWFVPLPPKAKHPKAKGKENFKKKRKTKEKYKEKIKPENFQYQPLFPQHFGSTAWGDLGPFGPFDGVRAAQQVVNRS